MKDFTAEDRVSIIALTPNTERAMMWIADYMAKAQPPREGDAYLIYPGYFVHVLLPAIKVDGLTVDGDFDESRRLHVRVRV
jgi:hypothetical protein